MRENYMLAKYTLGGIFGIGLGIKLIIEGDVWLGIGVIAIGVFVLAFLAFVELVSPPVKTTKEARSVSPSFLIWLGVGLLCAPGPLYFYLKFVAPVFELATFIYLGVALCVSGIGCICAGLFRLRLKQHVTNQCSVRDQAFDEAEATALSKSCAIHAACAPSPSHGNAEVGR
ncbi:MAG: hypothetical protein U0744_10405 [Gemmataceae bacterium]